MTLDQPTLDGIRALRLFHWRAACKAREQAKAAGERAEAASRDRQFMKADLNYAAKMVEQKVRKDVEADMHIKFVQTLNDFFPLGDYAEYDDAKETRNGN